MKVVAMTRVSGMEQKTEGYGLLAQERQIKEFCETNDHELVKLFVDVKSAKNDDRPGLQEMMEYLKNNKRKPEGERIDMVVVHKFDRWFRNQSDSAIYRLKLHSRGVKLHSLNENLMEDTPSGWISVEVMSMFAEYFVRNLSAEVKKGKDEMAASGLAPGRVPMGYTVHKGHVTPGPESDVALIKRIFEMGQTQGNRTIARILNEEGHVTGRNMKWGNGTVGKILRNRAYLGVLEYGKTARESGLSSPFRPLASPRFVKEGAWLPIIDEATFQTVASRRTAVSYSGKQGRSQRPIPSQLIRCSSDFSICLGSNHGRPAYKCGQIVRTGSCDCGTRDTRAEGIERAVFDVLARYLHNLGGQLARDVETHSDSTAQLDQLSERLDNVKNQIARLYDAISEGLDITLIKQRLAPLLEQKSSIETHILAMNDESFRAKHLGTMIEKIATTQSMFSTIESLPMHQQREIITALIERIELHDRGSRVKVFLKVQKVGVDDGGREERIPFL